MKKGGRESVQSQTDRLVGLLPAEGSIRQQSIEAPAALTQNGEQWYEQMSAKERSAVRNYSSLTDRPINQYLNRTRGVIEAEAMLTLISHNTHDEEGNELGERTEQTLASSIQTMDRALEAAPKLDEPHVVYRGMTLPDDKDPEEWARSTFPVGKNVVLPNFASASADPLIAQGFTRTHGVIMEIVTSQGAYMDDFSDYGGDVLFGEKEVLLKRNTRLRIVGIERGYIQEDAYYGEEREEAIFLRLVEVDDEEAREEGLKQAA